MGAVEPEDLATGGGPVFLVGYDAVQIAKAVVLVTWGKLIPATRAISEIIPPSFGAALFVALNTPLDLAAIATKLHGDFMLTGGGNGVRIPAMQSSSLRGSHGHDRGHLRY